MKQRSATIGLLLGAMVLAHATGCGGIYGGGGGGAKAEVMGSIDGVTPDTGRDIVVFVYRVKDAPADCTSPVLPEDGTPYESEELSDGATTFDLRNIKTGRFVVVFLLDNEGKDADGRIDPGDPIAVLDDPECVLDDVPKNYVVEINDVRANFGLGDVLGYPEPGRAEAGELKEYPEP